MADKRCDDHGTIFAGSSFANLTRTRRAAPQIKNIHLGLGLHSDAHRHQSALTYQRPDLAMTPKIFERRAN